MPTVTLSSGTFCYDVLDGGKQIVLLLEGLSAHLVAWRPELCERLRAAGFTVVRMDNRDAGLSQRFEDVPYTVADMADDAAELLQALGIGEAHVVGQSMGGMIAQELALRHPAQVSSLTLIYTAPGPDQVTLNVTDGPRRDLHRPPPRSREEAVEQYVEDERICASVAYPFDEQWKRHLAALMWDRRWDDGGAARQAAALEQSPDRTSRLGEIRVPTACIHGTADRLISPEGSRVLASRIPGATLHLFDGMGHEIPAPLIPAFSDIIIGNATRAEAPEQVEVTR